MTTATAVIHRPAPLHLAEVRAPQVQVQEVHLCTSPLRGGAGAAGVERFKTQVQARCGQVHPTSSYPQDRSVATMTVPAPKRPTDLVPCPRGCGATVHRTDWDDNHGFLTHHRHIDPHPLTQPEALACIIAGRPIYTWRTNRHGQHFHGAQSPWHPSDRHAPEHRCGGTFPTHVEPEQPFQLDTPPTTDLPF